MTDSAQCGMFMLIGVRIEFAKHGYIVRFRTVNRWIGRRLRPLHDFRQRLSPRSCAAKKIRYRRSHRRERMSTHCKVGKQKTICPNC